MIGEIVTLSLLEVGSLAFASDGWQADLARTWGGLKVTNELLRREASKAHYFTPDPPPIIARFHLP